MTALTLPAPLVRAVSDLAGIVTRLEECLADTDEPALVRVSCELAATAETVGAELGGSAAAAGSGFDRGDAAARAVGEALERYSACLVPAGRLVVSSARRLGPAALTPGERACFSAAQYREPGFPYAPLSLDSVIPWVDGVDLVTGRPAWAPAELVYLGRVEPGPRGPIGYATSSGLACAVAAGEARERALLELLERDAFVLAWRTRRALPHLDWRRDPRLRSLDERCFRRTGLVYHALDLSAEHDIPTVLGVCLGPAGSIAALGIGAAAGPTLADAWWRALAEAFAARTACRKLELADPGRRYADDGGDVHTFDDHIRFYASHDRAARAAFLWSGDEKRDPRLVPDLPRDPDERLEGLVERARRAGSRVVAVDVTAPDVAALGLHVSRVLAPGLCALDARHTARFLGSARLSGRDISTGLTHAPDDLNHDPHPFP